jgi:hypothetical protein
MEQERHPDDRVIAALWVGKPATIEEECRLYGGLLQQLHKHRGGMPGPVVVFEEAMVPIEELIECFTDDSVFIESAVFQARKKGITEASAGVIFFSASGESLWPDYPPDGEFVYLGLFAFPADEAYKDN